MYKYSHPRNQKIAQVLDLYQKSKTIQTQTNTSLKYVKNLQMTLQRTKNSLKRVGRTQTTYNTIELSFNKDLPIDIFQKKDTVNTFMMSRSKSNHKDKKQKVSKINPYTNSEYICFRSRKNMRKSDQIMKKHEKIHKILKPFSIYKIQPSSDNRKKPDLYIPRPKSTVQKEHLQRSRSRSTIKTHTKKNMSLFQKSQKVYQGQIKPWEHQYVNINF